MLRFALDWEEEHGLPPANSPTNYVRDSTLDQRDGFGPEIQQNNIQRFAE